MDKRFILELTVSRWRGVFSTVSGMFQGKVVPMSKTFVLGYKVEGFTHQKEGHNFKGYYRMEGQPN